MKKLCMIMVTCMLLTSAGLTLAQAPNILNFQGRLNDKSGNPVSDGNYSIRFSIYPTASGGTAAWSQTRTVTTRHGVFNVLLTNVNLNLSASAYYLAMKVGSDAEMTPRQRIASVPYALQANPWKQNGNHVYFDNTNGNVGIGTNTPTQSLTIGSGNILLPNGHSGTHGNLYFGGITHLGELGLRLWGGNGNNGRNIGGYIDVKTDSPTEGLIFRVDTRNGATERMRITSSGNVGIGTSNPQYKLHVAGTMKVEGNDIAEPFDMTDIDMLEKGDVVVIDPQNPLHVTKSALAYDSMVAGIVSSTEQAGYIAGSRSDGSSEKPVALAGRVLCKVSNENGPIQVGDLLTTSSVPGHAMKATDRDKAFGAILGKALQGFDGETGTIMVLVTLQ